MLALLLTLALFSYPALQNLVGRSKIEGAARETAATLRRARQEAVRRGAPVVVRVEEAAGQLVAFVDVDRDLVLDPPTGSPATDDLRLATLGTPTLVRYAGPPEDPAAVAGFAAGLAVFRPDGSVEQQGAVRLGDPKGNFLEVRVAPAATARVVVRKWVPREGGGGDWRESGEGGQPWQWNT